MAESQMQSGQRPPMLIIYRIGRLALVVMCLFATCILFFPIIRQIIDNDQTQNIKIIAPSSSLNPFELNFSLSETNDENTMTLTLDSIKVNEIVDDTSPCVDQIRLFTNLNSSPDVVSLITNDLEIPICNNVSRSDPVVETGLLITTINFQENIQTLYFPFDRRIAEFAISLPTQIASGVSKSESSVSTDFSLDLSINSPNWEGQVEGHDEELSFNNSRLIPTIPVGNNPGERYVNVNFLDQENVVVR